MRRLTYTAVEALLKKPPTQRVDLMDGAVPGLMLRVGPRGADLVDAHFVSLAKEA